MWSHITLIWKITAWIDPLQNDDFQGGIEYVYWRWWQVRLVDLVWGFVPCKKTNPGATPGHPFGFPRTNAGKTIINHPNWEWFIPPIYLWWFWGTQKWWMYLCNQGKPSNLYINPSFSWRKRLLWRRSLRKISKTLVNHLNSSTENQSLYE